MLTPNWAQGAPAPPALPLRGGLCSQLGRGTLTTGLAQGKNMPRQKSPRSGPPTMPKMLMAACGDMALSTSLPPWPPAGTGHPPAGCRSWGAPQPHPYLQHGAQHGGHVSHPQAKQSITKSWGREWGVTVVLGTPHCQRQSPLCAAPPLTQQLGEQRGP